MPPSFMSTPAREGPPSKRILERDAQCSKREGSSWRMGHVEGSAISSSFVSTT